MRPAPARLAGFDHTCTVSWVSSSGSSRPSPILCYRDLGTIFPRGTSHSPPGLHTTCPRRAFFMFRVAYRILPISRNWLARERKLGALPQASHRPEDTQ